MKLFWRKEETETRLDPYLRGVEQSVKDQGAFIKQVNKVQDGKLPFAELARLLPRVADREELIAVETVQLPLTWTFIVILWQLLMGR